MQHVLSTDVHLDMVGSQTWQALFRLAKPIIEAYESDLYHDAVWLHDNAEDMACRREPFDGFVYAVRRNGTHLLDLRTKENCAELTENLRQIAQAMYEVTYGASPLGDRYCRLTINDIT